MKENAPLILVTRPEPQASALAARLRKEGYEALAAPLSEYVDLPGNPPDLKAFDALAFTSARGVRVFSGRSSARLLPAFCVGSATAEEARARGFSSVHPGEGGAEDLARLIARAGVRDVLHVRGVDTARDLGALLPGVLVTRWEAYRAELLSRFPPEAEAALRSGRDITALLFSARAAARFSALLRPETIAARVEALALSPRVAGALEKLPWKAVRMAEAPRLDALLALLYTGPQKGVKS
jgi:uroporphyrinogen-III synthase